MHSPFKFSGEGFEAHIFENVSLSQNATIPLKTHHKITAAVCQQLIFLEVHNEIRSSIFVITEKKIYNSYVIHPEHFVLKTVSRGRTC